MPPATPQQRSKLPFAVTEHDLVWIKETRWKGLAASRTVAVVDRATGEKTLLVDLNGNGQFEGEEIRRFKPAPDDEGSFDLVWDFPLPHGPFRAVPVFFRILSSNSKPEGSQLLHINDWVEVRGSFNLHGKSVLAVFDYNPGKGALDPRNGGSGVDTNGDGKIDFRSESVEYALAQDETIIFRVGHQYVSLASIDLPRLHFAMRSHSASDYTRIELTPGVAVPDFAFMDFGGRTRRLSDFRGKYVLLDFWGSWCKPCVEELPSLKALYAKYREKNFEILGMTKDENPEAARKILDETGCPWISAHPTSVNGLIEKRFRIGSYPTWILLDPEGRIHSIIEGRKEANLEKFLKALPARTGLD